MGRGSLWFWMICRLCAAVFSVSECCHTRLLWDKVRILSWRLYKSVFTVTFLRQNSLCCFSNVISGNIPFECVAHICAKKWNRSVMEMRSPEIYIWDFWLGHCAWSQQWVPGFWMYWAGGFCDRLSYLLHATVLCSLLLDMTLSSTRRRAGVMGHSPVGQLCWRLKDRMKGFSP